MAIPVGAIARGMGAPTEVAGSIAHGLLWSRVEHP